MKPAIMSRSASIRRRFSLRNKVSSKSLMVDSSIRSEPTSSIRSDPASADTSIGEASITSECISTSSLSSADHECSHSVISNKSCPPAIASSSSPSHVGRRPSLMSRRRRSITGTVHRLDSLEEAPLDEESVRLASVISLLEQEDIVNFLKAAAEKDAPCTGLGHCRDEDEASSSDEYAKSSPSRRIHGSSSDGKGPSGDDGLSSSQDVSLEVEIEKLKAQLRDRLMEQQKRLVVGL